MNEWSWQDEAWRLYDAMGRVTSGTYNSTAGAIWQYQSTVTSMQSRFNDPQTGPDDDEGSAGVREPRRPKPFAPAGAAALALF